MTEIVMLMMNNHRPESVMLKHGKLSFSVPQKCESSELEPTHRTCVSRKF